MKGWTRDHIDRLRLTSGSADPSSAPRIEARREKTHRAASHHRAPNATESRYYRDHLEPRVGRDLAAIHYEAIRLRIGPPGTRCWYVVDWLCERTDGRLELHEVKGAHVWDDARVKLLAAARSYPSLRVVLGRWRDGEWTVDEIQRGWAAG